MPQAGSRWTPYACGGQQWRTWTDCTSLVRGLGPFGAGNHAGNNGERLGVSESAASPGIVRRREERKNLVSIQLWSTGVLAATVVAAAQQRIVQRRADMHAYEPDQIYNYG